LEIEGLHPSFYKAVNRKITQVLNPILDMYRPGLAREGDAILSTKERDKRIRVIKTQRSVKDKIKERISGGDKEDTSPT